MKNATIDVIIPVYNDRDYLMECVNSVLSQSFKDITLTLVDDCSNDGSAEMCDTIAQSDDRVQVIHNVSNLGVSGSREAGVNATGSPWVFFMDHDDLIKPDTLEMLFKHTSQGNLVCGRGEERNSSDIAALEWHGAGTDEVVVMSGAEACEKIVSENHGFGYIGSLWNKLIDRQIINRILEDTRQYKSKLNQVYFEDALCMPRLWHYADQVVVIDTFCYVHRRLNSSLSVSLNINEYLYQLVSADEIDIKFLSENGYKKAYEKILFGLFLMSQSVWYRSYINEKDDDKKAWFDNEVSRIITEHFDKLRGIDKSRSQKLQYINIVSFKNNRKRWARTFGYLWFEGIYKFPLIAKKFR